MARRNLSRTAIEGGRANRNKWERRHSSQVERANAHTTIAGTHGDSEVFDSLLFKEREKVGKDFDDKLKPVYRWLDSQVGRLWDKVRSDIHKRFDSRTTAGRHIMFDHLINMVARPGDRYFEYSQYIVDDNGFLRKQETSYGKRRREDRAKLRSFQRNQRNQLVSWLRNRAIRQVGTQLYWHTFDVERNLFKTVWHPGDNDRFVKKAIGFVFGRQGIHYLRFWTEEHKYYDSYYSQQTIKANTWAYVNKYNTHWKKDKVLTTSEMEYFYSLPVWLQEQVLKTGSFG